MKGAVLDGVSRERVKQDLNRDLRWPHVREQCDGG